LASSTAKKYLVLRGIGEKEWKFFMIGYFPGGRIFLNRFLKDMASKNVLAKDLVEAGVVAQGRNAMYSAFEERILFPIHDSLGRCCGFGGRVFAPADDRAKYYNSKESAWFLKGKLLFGLDLAKKDMQYAQNAFLVEGYTDCVAMVKHGYKNTVATLGTACTVDHLKTLSRFCKVLYVLYDGDSAGQKAILRLTRLCWEANIDLQIITLPSNQDPASFLDGGGDLKILIEKSSDIFTFFINSLGGQFWGKQLAEKVELCDKIIDVISRIDDSSIKKDLLLQRAATVMQVPFTSLKDMVDRTRVHGRVTGGEQKEKDVGPSLGEQIASLVINSVMSENMLFVDTDLLPYFSQQVRSILVKSEEFFKTHNGKKSCTFDCFLQSFSDPDQRDWVISRSFVLESDCPDILLEKLQFHFRKKNWRHIVRDMKKQIFMAKQENNKEKLQGLLTSFLSLKQEMKQRGLI
jgi:DNA primase